MTTDEYDYDLLVIGSGPGGQRAAVAAAKLGRRVGVVDRRSMVGGVCINTGTIPSKTLREAVLYLTGMAQRDMYGASYRVKDDIQISDLTARTQHVIGREVEVVRNQLLRNHIHLLAGTATFIDPHTLRVEGTERLTVSADKIVLALAPSRPVRLTSSSTPVTWSTPTASWRSRRSPPPCWSSAPGSSASSTRRCSRLSARE